MKKLLFLAMFLGGMVATTNAQSTKACCAGKEKTECAKKTSQKACCAKSDKASCSKKATGSASAKTVSAEATTTTFKVYGVCGMCKRTIEGALADVQGVNSASWDLGSKMLTVAYDDKSVKLDDIKAKVADAGYDSDTHRATKEAYNALHACCQYERPTGKL